ncbi:MAG: hypothetical protein ACRD1K_16495, partial [Acidimicrobiales bacterium]
FEAPAGPVASPAVRTATPGGDAGSSGLLLGVTVLAALGAGTALVARQRRSRAAAPAPGD